MSGNILATATIYDSISSLEEARIKAKVLDPSSQIKALVQINQTICNLLTLDMAVREALSNGTTTPSSGGTDAKKGTE